MPVEASSVPRLEPAAAGGWWFHRWASKRVLAGMTGRHTDLPSFLHQVQVPMKTVEAEQVHGGSLAMIERSTDHSFVAGCDALLTSESRLALLIRSADCLPLFFCTPSRSVIGIAHAGWRGLAIQLPMKVVAAFRHLYHVRPEELHVAIGPAIRSCCYEVGPEFRAPFGAFISERDGRRTCDLIGVAVDQLRQCGIHGSQVFDSQSCTACETRQWFSLRREGQAAGRMTSLIALRP